MSRKSCARCGKNEEQYDVVLLHPPPPPPELAPATKLMCNVCHKELGPTGVIRFYYPGYKEEKKPPKHPTTIQGLTMHKLAREVASLRYDALSDFFRCLGRYLREDSVADEKKGRRKISFLLRNVATHQEPSERLCDKLWEICEPYMKEDDHES